MPCCYDLGSATQASINGAAIRIDIEVCSRCGGSVRVIVDASNRCIEDQDIIDKILAHLRDKEQGTPTLPHLAPPTRAPPEALPLFAGKESASLRFNQQRSH